MDAATEATGGIPPPASTGNDAPAPCERSQSRGTWAELPDLAIGRTEHSVTLLDSGDIIVVGGRTCSESAELIAAAERFSIATQSWVDLSAMAVPRAGQAAVAVGDDVVVIGGATERGATPGVLRYFEAEDEWSQIGSFPFASGSPVLVRLDDGTLLAGGHEPTEFLVWFISLDDGATWSETPPGPTQGPPFFDATLFGLSGARAMFVGTWGLPAVYSAEADTWTQAASTLSPFLGAGGPLGSGQVLFLTGAPTPDQASQGTVQYSPAGIVGGPALEDGVNVGFTRCAPETGQLEQYEAAAWAADGRSVFVSTTGATSIFDVDEGWSHPPPDPTPSKGYEAVAERDGSFFKVGGCDNGRAVRRWSP